MNADEMLLTNMVEYQKMELSQEKEKDAQR